MVMGDEEPTPFTPPGEEVTVYSVIGSPLEAGVEKETTASPDAPRALDTAVGADGTVAGVMLAEEEEGSEVPTLFFEVTVNV